VERSVDVGEVGPIGRRGVDVLGVDIPCERGHRERASPVRAPRWMVPSSLYSVVKGRIDVRERHAPGLILPAEVVTTEG